MKKLLSLTFVAITLFCSTTTSFAGNCGSCMKTTAEILQTYVAPAVEIAGQLLQQSTVEGFLAKLDALRSEHPEALTALYEACQRRTGLDVERQRDIVDILFAAGFVGADGRITRDELIPLILKAVVVAAPSRSVGEVALEEVDVRSSGLRTLNFDQLRTQEGVTYHPRVEFRATTRR